MHFLYSLSELWSTIFVIKKKWMTKDQPAEDDATECFLPLTDCYSRKRDFFKKSSQPDGRRHVFCHCGGVLTFVHLTVKKFIRNKDELTTWFTCNIHTEFSVKTANKPNDMKFFLVAIHSNIPLHFSHRSYSPREVCKLQLFPKALTVCCL